MTTFTTTRTARTLTAVGKGAAGRPPSRSLSFLTLALIAGLALGRFLTFQADPVAPPAVPAARVPEQTIALLEERVARHPDELRSLQALGLAYLRRAFQLGDPAFYALAEEALDRAEALRPADPQTSLVRAALALARHEFAAALELAVAVHRIDPFAADALVIMVDSQVELGRYREAADTLQELLHLRPNLAALARLSYLRELHGDVAGALEAMQQARTAGEASPFDLATVEALMGDLYFNQGNPEAAEAAYERALQLFPDLTLARVGQARTLAAGGKSAAAIAELRRVLDRVPNLAAATLLADLLTLEGRPAEAGQAVELMRAIAVLQQEAGQVVDLEMALFEADHGEPVPAVELARAAYTARPTIHAADAWAWALLRSGQPRQAGPLMEEALRLGTADASLHFHAAVLFAELGDLDRARTELQAALVINPWFSFLHRAQARELAGTLGVAPPAEWGDT